MPIIAFFRPAGIEGKVDSSLGYFFGSGAVTTKAKCNLRIAA